MAETHLRDPVDMGLLERVTRGNREKIRMLLSLYVKQNSQSLQALRQAITAGDVEQVRQTAHAMAGASAFLGASELVLPLMELEQIGKSGRLAPQSLDLFARAEKEFARIQTFFDAL